MNANKHITRSSIHRMYDRNTLNCCGINNEETMQTDSNNVDQNNYLDTENENSIAQWADLPQEILTKVFSYLTICETEMVENTCLSWSKACNVPSLWRRVVFNFDGADSLQLMSDALRLISSKGQFTRDLVLTIGRPGLNQAWLMSGCIQQLLDFICQSPCNSIETFRMSNLVVFTQNRFFKLSKESILTSMNKFLRSQRNLKSVSFSCCKFNPGEGLKVLRALKCFRFTLKHLELHDFFKRRYVSATKAFKIVSTLTQLEDLSLDADYITDKMLMWLVEKWPKRKPLHRIKIYFRAWLPPAAVSAESWLSLRRCFQEMKVSFHIDGIFNSPLLEPFITAAIPLSECIIQWIHYRAVPAEHLTKLITSLATKQSALLERFSLSTDMNSCPEFENALLLLASSCGRLTEMYIEVNLLSYNAMKSISDMLKVRNRPVTFRFRAPQRSERLRGCRNRGR